MTSVTVAHTELTESAAAGRALGAEIAAAFAGQAPDALILFASPAHDYARLLAEVQATCHPGALVGCSSSGEFSSHGNHDRSACALALRSAEMHFAVGIGRGLRADRVAAARALVSAFQGPATHAYPFRTALVFTDALAGYADDLIDHVTRLTAGTYQLVGGGAGDDAQFQQTHVFYGTEAATDAVVALEILSLHPIGIGVGHGWRPASPPMRVTEAAETRLVSLNASAAAEAFAEHAAATEQRFDPSDPLPFFLHNVIGVDEGADQKLRVPLAVNVDGSVACATEVPTGAIAHIMGTTTPSAAAAATRATQAALAQLGGRQPAAALFFDCAATRLRMGRDFDLELGALREALGAAPYAGCNTFGQIARAEGQFSGFHNCTAVVCLLPG